MRLTDEQHSRLPEILREVVEIDRAIEDLLEGDVVPIGVSERLAELTETRARLSRAAAARWGPAIAGDGDGRA